MITLTPRHLHSPMVTWKEGIVRPTRDPHPLEVVLPPTTPTPTSFLYGNRERRETSYNTIFEARVPETKTRSSTPEPGETHSGGSGWCGTGEDAKSSGKVRVVETSGGPNKETVGTVYSDY